MCGICGVVVTDGPPPDRELVTRMIGRLRHRGPDGSGLYLDDQAALGHTRLAIIDTEGGAQPLCNEDGTLWISFNGEIFNYVELGDELRRRGHRFRTHSDTEVIVHAWEEWGEDCFTRFNGQWALALWDSRERRLVLSRDRLGVRPLFFTRDAHRIAFASEVKALMADPEVPRELDPVGLDQVLTYWSTVAPRTVFRGIEQLEPGHVAVLDRDGFRRRPYWSADFPARGAEPGQDVEENARELRERIVEAARLRFLRSDVPVGAYLSGGIDSSITAAVIARYTDAPLHTFSLRFADAEYDEGVHQQRMVAQLGAQHQDITVSPADVAEVFPDVVLHTETPILRTAPAPLFLLSRLVRQNGYKVVVTGEGADEVLAGYDIFREGRVRAFWARDPGSTTRDRAVELLYPWMANNPGQAPAFARSFFGQDLDPDDPAISHRPRWASTSAVKGMLAPGLLDEVVRGAGDDVLALLPPQSASWDPLSRAQWLEMTTLLPGYILSSQGDRMLMANSVEGRFPFLDKDVIAFANQLPARHKLNGLDEKHLLKLAFEDLVPEEIRRRPKQPYRAPDTASFFTDTPPDWLGDVTSPAAVADAGVFNPRAVQGLLTKAARTHGVRTGNTDNMRLLAVVSTQLLHQQLVVDAGRATDNHPPEPMTVIDRVQPVRSTA
ncbi:asparagine synthase [Nocardioides sp. Root122]|uniref:asparagine synthase (glutamine-hydrolyzing) n=1 Tax=Nocardioides TaxID=1839 RepID=UPI0007024280|nr:MULTISPECIES: asparagine synthase (glutamine-hydrolyzing) [Nocardioides]KQV78003.1 asparagine synthase [Nocardioides sp. Root122]MCK9825068.1 asparagine synthase (glutamine-hydrolyzing) [Nocardioides cavernae]